MSAEPAVGAATANDATVNVVQGPPADPQRFFDTKVAHLEEQLAKHEELVAKLPGLQARLDQLVAENQAKAAAVVAARDAAQAELEETRAAGPDGVRDQVIATALANATNDEAVATLQAAIRTGSNEDIEAAVRAAVTAARPEGA